MEERVNVAELLKDCPHGMELNCILYDNIYFDTVGHNTIKCYIQNKGYRTSITFDFYGGLIDSIPTKCVIFPKGKTTWKGFVPPCKFKDGDILYAIDEDSEFIFILKHIFEHGPVYCYLSLKGYDLRIQEVWLTDYNDTHRLATEKEKEKLFKAIKDNGYKWNAETKTLEKLVEPKFKVGDRIRKENNNSKVYTINGVHSSMYGVEERDFGILIEEQDEWELVPNKFDITTLVPFESRVLVRDSTTGIWYPEFFGCLLNSNNYPYMVLGGNRWKYCVPYEGNEHLLNTNNDCDDYYKTWE